MNKLILIFLMVLIVPSVFAWFPEKHEDRKINLYSEICIEEKVINKWGGWFFGGTTKEVICDFKEVVICNQEYPLMYACQKDAQRECSRDCWEYKLSYSNYVYGNLFKNEECWCNQCSGGDFLPIRIR